MGKTATMCPGDFAMVNSQEADQIRAFVLFQLPSFLAERTKDVTGGFLESRPQPLSYTLQLRIPL